MTTKDNIGFITSVKIPGSSEATINVSAVAEVGRDSNGIFSVSKLGIKDFAGNSYDENTICFNRRNLEYSAIEAALELFPEEFKFDGLATFAMI